MGRSSAGEEMAKVKIYSFLFIRILQIFHKHITFEKTFLQLAIIHR